MSSSKFLLKKNRLQFS